MLSLISCNQNSDTEIVQDNRNRVVNVSDKIIDIKSDVIFGNGLLYILDDILIIHEVSPKNEKGIHLFNKNTFQYLASTGYNGRGPGEILIPGCIGVDKSNRLLWVLDHGNSVIWKFPIDSILKNDKFHPSEKVDLNGELFIDRLEVLNDSIILGKAVQMTSKASFIKVMAKFNIKDNKITLFGYENPKTEGRYSSSEFAISRENNFYVNCYYYCDLMTICDLKGNLKYNIYGPDVSFDNEFKKTYFFGVKTCNEKIIASYIGDRATIELANRSVGNTPSKFLVFDKNGKYERTLDTGSKFTYFCVDEENNRIIAYFNERNEPLGYFSMN
jgi:hypothetical protein